MPNFCWTSRIYDKQPRCGCCFEVFSVLPYKLCYLLHNLTWRPTSISGNFRLEPCSHGDFLGAILGTGITREKVGDILLQVFCCPNLCFWMTWPFPVIFPFLIGMYILISVRGKEVLRSLLIQNLLTIWSLLSKRYITYLISRESVLAQFMIYTSLLCTYPWSSD